MAQDTTRRTFIKHGSATAAGITLASTLGSTAHAQGSEEIKIALVGCGGRGSGAVAQMFNTKGKTRLIAVADAFEDKAAGALKNLSNEAKNKQNATVDVPQDRVFVGLDSYKAAIDAGPDVVVIATPPGFKPQQFEYAVAKGKHVFCEKPVASDAPGVRRFLAAVEESKKKKLMVGIGLQRRHEGKYVNTIKAVHDGAIGDLIAIRVYWNGGGIWYRDRRPNDTEMSFQVNNWYHFIWTCGDQICEQHIHNLDVGCWAKNAWPVKANGMGGHERRMDGQGVKSQIYDHTFVEYTFPDGTKMWSQGRHLGGKSYQNVSEHLHGTKGESNANGWTKLYSGEQTKYEGGGGGHQQEQHDLIEALMRNEVYNEGEYGAKSTFTAILGREACYSGRELGWDDLLAKGHDYCPGIDSYTMDTNPPAMPIEGRYPIPKPGEWDPFA